ncbi:hypothetical protein D3C83_320980 [compost metagenome]
MRADIRSDDPLITYGAATVIEGGIAIPVAISPIASSGTKFVVVYGVRIPWSYTLLQ